MSEKHLLTCGLLGPPTGFLSPKTQVGLGICLLGAMGVLGALSAAVGTRSLSLRSPVESSENNDLWIPPGRC